MPTALGRALGPQRDPGCPGPEAWAEAVIRRDALCTVPHGMGLCIMAEEEASIALTQGDKEVLPCGEGPSSWSTLRISQPVLKLWREAPS